MNFIANECLFIPKEYFFTFYAAKINMTTTEYKKYNMFHSIKNFILKTLQFIKNALVVMGCQ